MVSKGIFKKLKDWKESWIASLKEIYNLTSMWHLGRSEMKNIFTIKVSSNKKSKNFKDKLIKLTNL